MVTTTEIYDPKPWTKDLERAITTYKPGIPPSLIPALLTQRTFRDNSIVLENFPIHLDIREVVHGDDVLTKEYLTARAAKVVGVEDNYTNFPWYELMLTEREMAINRLYESQNRMTRLNFSGYPSSKWDSNYMTKK